MQTITTEVLKNSNIKVPIITEIYDPLSGKRDGTITSQAPIVVNGKHLNLFDQDCITLCLTTSSHAAGLIIDVHKVYKYSSEQVIMSLPVLVPDTYFPTMKIQRENKEDSLYIFPVSWTVTPECSD